MSEEKAVVWVGSSKRDLLKFPNEVVDEVGYALDTVQRGGKPKNAKPLLGFGGANVLEVVEDFDTDTYRAVYTVRFAEKVYVLHCFQKKSTHGSKTPQHDTQLIKQRLKAAEEIHKEWIKTQEGAHRRRIDPAPEKRKE
ncbi:type II toxin-antitoxin system RelE/ParE family toxin [Fimbriimonas ginsengisoli]|uniref:Addiction module toxin RelE n=1 Tax=Fimbriimonas ginsengisoli Gsoil 348 TaxID=661478 RepID=A0A068NVS9_FIMGI|nr:type II toxin-antitoxin system RelE/ParE family toxin [Fimbriimonas ginsengisoli]AIE87472.1 hypothetical protein OP10G_4104 [Fimbriimonas ginsengisoli Gsoil 348]